MVENYVCNCAYMCIATDMKINVEVYSRPKLNCTE